MAICLLVEVRTDHQAVLYDTRKQENFTVLLSDNDLNLVLSMVSSSQNDEAIYLQVDQLKKTLIWND
ncbi:hypothetical protein [Listeria fleischmannii]|uniref:hypothetical protein n=1 Tax=Listeria fleischmannii TaxID=1069827 RepID=UPI0016259216|nr:hypothetical protein [Listeria fleischmannii]MBC1419889.1 hypothetical protein [Listeria fleischmannii]